MLEVGLHTLLYGEADPYESNQKMMEEIFKGDITVTIHRMIKKGPSEEGPSEISE